MGGRDSRRCIADQLTGYRNGFRLPIVVVTCWKWKEDGFDTDFKRSDLRRGRNIFFFNYSVQSIISLAAKSITHRGVTHARFALIGDDALVLTRPGHPETGTAGLCWSRKFEDLYLPVCGLTQGKNPFDWPFTTRQRNETYRRARETNDAKKLSAFRERIKFSVDRSNKVKILWPQRGLLGQFKELVVDVD